ncbi:MAG: peptide chain release factor N(5)-glutamine methyltransferase [Gemmatimonadaceae bacterium]
MSDSRSGSLTLPHGDICLGELMAACSDLLESRGVNDGQRESRDIVAALLDVPRFWPTANLGTSASRELEQTVLRAAERRAAGAPFAYAVGRASFRHLTLDVDERVLIPRVETEVIVERILERCGRGTRTIADVGTGSGAIALSLAFEGEFAAVIGTDISLDAIVVAKQNANSLARALKSPVEFRHGALLAPVAELQLDAIVCNPPYISFAEAIELPPEVRNWEPSISLFCREEGLQVTRDLVRGAPALIRSGGLLALEIDTRRAGTVAEFIAADGRYEGIEVLLDLTGRERFVFARRV